MALTLSLADPGLPPWGPETLGLAVSQGRTIFGTDSTTNTLYNLRQVTYLLWASVFPCGKLGNNDNHSDGEQILLDTEVSAFPCLM